MLGLKLILDVGHLEVFTSSLIFGIRPKPFCVENLTIPYFTRRFLALHEKNRGKWQLVRLLPKTYCNLFCCSVSDQEKSFATLIVEVRPIGTDVVVGEG